MTTDTPRTDAAFGQGKHGVMKLPYETSCQLERELTELWSRFDKQMEAEAEVERLKGQLESTKQIAVKFWNVLEENGFKMELPQ